MSFEQDYDYALNKLKEYENFIELPNWRDLVVLLLSIYTRDTRAIINKVMGKNKGGTRLIIPYDPRYKIYFAKFLRSKKDLTSIVFYIKDPSGEGPKNLIHTLESDLIKENFSKLEISTILPPNLYIVTPTVYDFSHEVERMVNAKKGTRIGINVMFTDLAEFLITEDIDSIFLIKDDAEDSPGDICFSLNISLDAISPDDNMIQVLDVYIDKERKLRNYEFIRIEAKDLNKGKFNIEFLKEMKEFSHGELFNSQFSLIIPISSFNKPQLA